MERHSLRGITGRSSEDRPLVSMLLAVFALMLTAACTPLNPPSMADVTAPVPPVPVAAAQVPPTVASPLPSPSPSPSPVAAALTPAPTPSPVPPAPTPAAAAVPSPTPTGAERRIVLEEQPPRISVVGEGVALAQPNTAEVVLGVEVTDPSLQQAQAEARRRMEAIIQALRNAGVPENNIRTVRFSINPQSRPEEPGQVQAYEVQNLVEVRTTDIGNLGQLIDQAVQAGATRVASVQFETDAPEQVRAQAFQRAVQEARATAEVLARTAGVTLGQPILIEEAQVGDVRPVQAAPLAAAQAPTTPIQPGEQEVRARVHVVWAIQ